MGSRLVSSLLRRGSINRHQSTLSSEQVRRCLLHPSLAGLPLIWSLSEHGTSAAGAATSLFCAGRTSP